MNKEIRPSHRERNSNLKLYRIICMFLIVCHHYVVSSGLLDKLYDNPLSNYSIFYYLFGMWGKTGINCFVMITGYFMCRSNITKMKFLKLVIQILFYNIVIYSIFITTGYVNFNFKELIDTIWFIHGINGSFVPEFIMFYLCIPFLNALVHNISKRQHQLLICLLVSLYSIHALPFLMYQVKFNYVSWFCILYFISSYIRLYPSRYYDKKTWLWATLSIVCIAFSVLTVIWQLNKGMSWPYNYVCDSNQILPVLTGFSTFILFKDLPIPQNRIINNIAATTFGILLIHANSDLMRQWLWKDVVDCVGNYNNIMYGVCSCAVVFLICSLLEFIRIKTMEPYYLQRLR